MAETDYVGTGIYALRTEAGKKAKCTGQTLNQRNKWSRRECLDFLTLGTMPERFTPIVIDDQLPMFDNTSAMTPAETSIASDDVPFADSEPILVEALKTPLPVKDIPPAPLKTPLPAVKPQGKQKAVLASGRNSKSLPSFEKWFCQIFPKDITYPAWKYLSKTATDVANICRAKSNRGAHANEKDSTGRPVFSFTFAEAATVFTIPPITFSDAIKRIIEIGFMECSRPGGLVNGESVPALYRLSDKWKTWEPPKKDYSNMEKARASRKQNPTKGTLSTYAKGTLSGEGGKMANTAKGTLSDNPYFPT